MGMNKYFKYLKGLLQLSLSLALLTFLYWVLRHKVDGLQIVSMIRSISIWSVIAALCIVWLNVLVSAERFRLAISHLVQQAPGIALLFRVNLIGFFVAYLAPVGAANDITRIGYARRRLNIPLGKAIETVIFDRLLALVGIIVTALILIPVQAFCGIEFGTWLSQLVFWVLAGAFLFILLAIGRHFHGITNKWVMTFLGSMNNFSRMFSTGRSIALHFSLGIGYCGTFGLLMWVVGIGMGIKIDLLLTIAVTPLVMLAQNLPIFYAGWGAREAVTVISLGTIGALTADQALALSISTGLILFVASLPAAAMLLWDFIAYSNAILHKNARKTNQIEG